MTENLPDKRPTLTAGRGIAPIVPIVPKDIEQAYRLATAIAKSKMAPKGYNNADEILIGIMHGMEAGLTPMAALQSITVINGNPTIWGDGAMALVRGSGLCKYVKEWIDGEGDEMVAYCETQRKNESDTVRRSFSVADAKVAGLWSKAGPWKNYPKRMLQMRARAFCLRDVYADVLRGLRVTEEERDIQLVESETGEYVPADKPAREDKATDHTLLPLIEFTGNETDLMFASQWIDLFKEQWTAASIEERALLIDSNREIAKEWAAAGESEPMRTWNEYACALDLDKEAEAKEAETVEDAEVVSTEDEGVDTSEEQVDESDTSDDEPPMPEPERKPVVEITVAPNMTVEDLTEFVKRLDKVFADAPDAAWLKEWRDVNAKKIDELKPKAKARVWKSFEKQMVARV